MSTRLLAAALVFLPVVPCQESQPASRPEAARPDLGAVVRSGLRWLAGHRQADGHWRAETAGRQPGSDALTTSLTLLAFLGSGSTPDAGPHAQVVREAVHWLQTQQSPSDGFVGVRAGGMAMAGHAAATLALTETLVLAPDDRLRDAAARAIGHLLTAREHGGIWPRDPRGGPEDRWALAWAVLALRSARDARVPVADAALEEVVAWLARHTEPDTGRLPASAPHVLATPETLTAGGLLCRSFLGQTPAEFPIMANAADTLVAAQARMTAAGRGPDAGLAYFGTAALFQLGGSWEREWSGSLPGLLARTQASGGADAGSWSPATSFDRELGRTATTALLVLCSEILHRAARMR